MYFNNFPLIQFSSVKGGEPKIVTNLLRRVALRAKVKENTMMFDTYDVREGETPEMIAHKLYGDAELHWIVCMTNDIVNRFHDWPMNTNQFLSYVRDKYDNPNAVHHYEISATSGDTTKKIEVYNNSALYSGDTDFYANATAVTNLEYEESQQEARRKIKLLDPAYLGQFVKEFELLMKESII